MQSDCCAETEQSLQLPPEQLQATSSQPSVTAEEHTTIRKEWSHPAILLLIELYRKYRTQFKSAKHVKNVWQKIATDMNSEGREVTWQLCEKKFRNMKGTYKDIKDHHRQSGRGRKKWPYFEVFSELLGTEPAISPSPTEIGSKETVTVTVEGTNVAQHSAEVELEPAASATCEPSSSGKSSTVDRGSRKRKRAAENKPAWFTEFIEETKKNEHAKLELLQQMHDEQKKSAGERLIVMKNLNDNIKTLIDKL